MIDADDELTAEQKKLLDQVYTHAPAPAHELSEIMFQTLCGQNSKAPLLPRFDAACAALKEALPEAMREERAFNRILTAMHERAAGKREMEMLAGHVPQEIAIPPRPAASKPDTAPEEDGPASATAVSTSFHMGRMHDVRIEAALTGRKR